MINSAPIPVDPFAAASALALADLAGADAPAVEPAAAPASTPAEASGAAEAAPASDPVQPAEVAAPATSASASDATNPAAAPAGEPSTTTSDVVWRLNRKGQMVEVTDPAELRRLAEQGYDYTQKTQELAEQRKAVQAREQDLLTLAQKLTAEREAEKAKLQALWGNKAIVKAWADELEAAEAAQQPAAQGDPNEFATLRDANAIAERAAQRAAQLFEQQRAAEKEQLSKAVTAHQHKTLADSANRQLDEALAGVIKAHPALGEIEGISRLLLDDIAPAVVARIQADPQTPMPIDEIAVLLREKAGARAVKEEARIKRHVDMAAVRAAKDKPKVQTAPPGGSAPTLQPASAKPMKLGSRELTQSVVEELEAAFRAKK